MPLFFLGGLLELGLASARRSPGLQDYGVLAIISANMRPTDLEHPDAIAEATAIYQLGIASYQFALGEMVGVLNSFFDGPGTPPYLGASRLPAVVMFEHATAGAVRMFSRQFWSSTGSASVVACVGQKVDRPALLSVVAVGLAVGGAAALDDQEAEAQAVRLAKHRASAL